MRNKKVHFQGTLDCKTRIKINLFIEKVCAEKINILSSIYDLKMQENPAGEKWNRSMSDKLWWLGS